MPKPPNSSLSVQSTLNPSHAAIARALTDWFQTAQRDLPWRRAENMRDAYRVLVSEVMLQQTTVAAVIPFYERFIARFPTLESLAQSSIEDVLPLWAGLGYYSRARNLHACAQVVMRDFGGNFPQELDKVLSLPGIGRYTAGAVTSIAFDQPNPIVDANVARVFARVWCIEGDIKSTLNQKTVWQHAETLVQEGAASGCAPSQLNPAIMELGALICRPKEPDCARCPIENFCAARAAGRQNELPQFAPKPQSIALHDACVFIQSTLDGTPKVLLRRRPHDEPIWWRGMWELPRVRVQNESPQSTLAQWLRDELQIEVEIGDKLKTMRHGVTQHLITLDCFAGEVQRVARGDEIRWFAWDEVNALALPSTMRQLLQWLEKHPRGNEQLSLL